jgi:hypothetical protein
MNKYRVTTMPIRLLSYAAMISAGLVGSTLNSGAQSAYDYPFCGVYQDRSGATSCYFASYEQCMATMRGGNMGYCKNNPFYRGPTMIDPARRKARRH